jgi:hypothetical protein
MLEISNLDLFHYINPLPTPKPQGAAPERNMAV